MLSIVHCPGVSSTGAALISSQLGTATITIQGSNDPHGVFSFATASLAVTATESAGVINLQVDRKFGAIGKVWCSDTRL
jgi:G-protein coupled receptor 98